MKDSKPVTFRCRLIGCMGLFESHISGNRQNRIDLWIKSIDHLEIMLSRPHGLSRGHCRSSIARNETHYLLADELL
jgi:hypothetical protein